MYVLFQGNFLLNICQAQVGDQNELATTVFEKMDLGFTCIFTVGTCVANLDVCARLFFRITRSVCLIRWQSGRIGSQYVCYLIHGIRARCLELV